MQPLFVLIIMFSLTTFCVRDPNLVDSQTTSANKIVAWPQASDLPLQPVTTLSNINCDIFNLTSLFPGANTSLIITDSIITNTVIFSSSFSLQNGSIKFINTKLRVIRRRDAFMLLLSGASLEFHNCTIVPPNQHQPAEWRCNASKCAPSYYDPEYYAQGLQLMIAQNSSEYDIVIKGCTYRFVSDDKSFLLNASTMPYGFGIKIQTAFNDSMLNYSFRNIHIVDNYFETNHGAMDFFALRFDASYVDMSRRLTGNMINISGNTVVMRQIEGGDLMLARGSSGEFRAVLGSQIDGALQLRSMVLDDNNVDVREVTPPSFSKLVVFLYGVVWESVNCSVKQLSVSRNKVVMSPIFSERLYHDVEKAWVIRDLSQAVYEVRVLSIDGLNHVDEIIINDNDIFITTGAVSAFYLSFGTFRRWFLNGKEQLVGSTSANIGNVTISRNNVASRDTLDSSVIFVSCYGTCEHFGSFLVSHNNFSTFLDQKNSNFTAFLDHEFRAVSHWGFIFAGSFVDSAMRDVGRISAVYNTIHLEGSPCAQGFSNYISLQDCKLLEYSFNNVTLIQDDRKDRPFSVGTLFFSFAYGVRVSSNVLRISKLEIQQNNILAMSKAGANDLVGIDVTTAFDPRTRNATETNPSVVPMEFSDRPELVYKNASIWNNTVKMVKIGSQSMEALASSVRVGALNQSIDIGYFYIFNNSLISLTNAPSPAAGMNGITITTSGYTRNFSAAIISNNKIRIGGVSGIVSGVSFQTMEGFDSSEVVLAKFYIGDGETKNFKKMVVEKNDIQVSNLKGAAAAVTCFGAGAFQMENLELRNNTVLLTSRSLTEDFGSDPFFAPYSRFAGIDTAKIASFPQDQHSYFYALCPYGTLFGFVNIMTKNGLAVSVGKMTIENEKITLEKSGSFFATRLGFYITEYLNVQNINMKSLGIVDSTFRRSVVSSIFIIDSSSLGFQGLEYFSSVFPRIAKISVINSIFSIQLPSSCDDILNSNDKTITNNQLSFINILPAPSTTVATTIVGDLIIQNVSFTQDCSAGSNMPSSTSSTNNIINIPKAATANTRTSINVTDLNIVSLPTTNFFISQRNGKLISSTSTSSSSTSAATSASIKCTTWNGNIVNARSVSAKSAAAEFVSSPSLLQVRCNNDFKSSLSKTRSQIVSKSDLTPTISGDSKTATRSVSDDVWLPDVGNSAAAEKAVAVAQVATMLSGNPALSLAVSRSAVLFRLASCHVNQKDLSPEKLAFRFEGHSKKKMTKDLYFPLSLIPGARVGANHVGSSYRGGLVIYIVVFSLVVIIVLYVGSLNRDTWQKHQRKIVDANRNVSRKPEKRDPAFGVGPFWKHAPIDRGILLPFSLVAPFWCEVAGGLATGAPNGASDAVLALLPIILFCIVVIYAGKCVFEFTSSQQKSLSNEQQPQKKKDKQPNEAEVKNPQNFMVESELYISRALLTEKPARATMRERLISPVGRFMFIGNHCWATNPALIFHEDEATTLNLDELEDVAIEMQPAIGSKKFAPLFPPSPSLRMTPRYGKSEWLPMSGIATQFGGWLRALQLPLKIKSEQLSPQTRRREHRVPQFDFSLRSRIQLVWLAITLSVTIIVCCIGGAATVEPSMCHASFFVVLVLCVVDLILLAWLRPFVVPFKTVSNLIIDSGTVIGGLILLSCVVSSDRAETLVDTMSAGMMMCALPGSILGPIALILFIVRMGCVMIFCKATVVPKTKLQELRIRMRGESNNNTNNRDSSAMKHFGDELLLQPPEEFQRSPRNRAQFRGNGETDRQHHLQRHRESSSSSSTFDSHRRRGAPSCGSMRPFHNHDHHREMMMARSSWENNEQNNRNPNILNNDNNNKAPFSSYREPQGFLKGLF